MSQKIPSKPSTICSKIRYLVFLFLFFLTPLQAYELSFIALDIASGERLQEVGPSLNVLMPPYCSFNILLAIAGFEEGVLENRELPIWECPEASLNRARHTEAQNPETWMKKSVVWYSQLLAKELSQNTLRTYLQACGYGNRDLSGKPEAGKDFTWAWLDTSLEISPVDQVEFIRKLLSEDLPFSESSITSAKELLFLRDLPSEWKFYGKTGGGDREEGVFAWFVGWLEREEEEIAFALLIRNAPKYPSRKSTQGLVLSFLADALQDPVHNAMGDKVGDVPSKEANFTDET